MWQATGETAKMKKRSELRDRLGGGLSPHVKRVRREGSVAKAERMAAKEREASNVVRLGDASMASAFTAKATSVEPCRDLIRQGRCTLVTMLQMYKILGVNCLCTAYILSVQNLQGVKQGDIQV
jgi:cation-transporting ATPase 13A1